MINKLQRTWKQSRLSKSFIVLLILFTLTGVVSLVSAQALGSLTENIMIFNRDVLVYAMIIFIVSSALEIITRYFSSIYQSKAIETMRLRFKQDTVKHLIESPYEFSASQEQGDILGRLDNDVSSIATATNMSIDVVKSLLLIVILSIGMFFINPKLLLLFLIAFPLIALVQFVISKSSSGLVLPWKVAMGTTNSVIQDVINNRSTIRVFQVYDYISKWVDTVLKDSSKKAITGIGRLYLYQIPMLILTLSPSLVVAVGGAFLVNQGEMSLADLVSAFSLSQLSFDHFNLLNNSLQNIPHLIASSERIFPIWDAGEEAFGTNIGKSDPLILLDNVSFSYGDDEVLKSINLEINEGEHIAFVGTSGSGKSTLFNLLLGFYAPKSGSVKIRGIEVQDWDKKSLRNMYSVVSQNTYLFNESIRNNLRYANRDASDDDIAKALNDVSLKQSLDLVVGEKGSRLSGGERQRMAIARVLLRHSPIVLFDEATSALDVETEEAIQLIMEDKRKGATHLMIAHRFSSIVACDRIYVMDQGSIVESGTHEELMNSKGLYFNLFEKQRKGEDNE